MNLAFTLFLALQTLVVANQGAESVSFVDTQSMHVKKTIAAGLGPHEAAASPDGKLAAVSLYGRQTPNKEVLIMNVKSRAIIQRISLGNSERPHGLVWRDGGIYLTLEKEGAVARIDPRNGWVTWRAKTNGEIGHMLAVTHDESKLYTGNIKSNDVSVIRVGEDAAYTKIPVGAGPEGIALSPDDRELWAAHRAGGGISIIDTSRDAVVATIAPDIYSARLTFTPDGRKVLAYDMASKSVVIFDRQARKELGRVPFAEGVPVSGSVAEDSRKAWVVRYQPDALVELDLDAMKIGRTVAMPSMPDGLALVR